MSVLRVAADTVAQLAGVGVAFTGNHGVLIQRRGVADDDLITRSQRVAERLGKADLKRVTIIQALGNNSVVRCVDGSAVQGNFTHTRVGEARAHRVMEHVVLGTRLGDDGALEVDSLAHIGVVLLAVSSRSGVLLDRLHVRGDLVLFFHYHVGIGGVERAEGAERGVNQVITKFKTCK